MENKTPLEDCKRILDMQTMKGPLINMSNTILEEIEKMKYQIADLYDRFQALEDVVNDTPEDE